MTTKEQFYDERIAPVLADLAKQCEERDLSLIAACEWAPGTYGSTSLMQPDAGIGMRMVRLAVHANGNIDSFMFAMMKHAREHGHGSAILNQLGIPVAPDAKDQADKSDCHGPDWTGRDGEYLK